MGHILIGIDLESFFSKRLISTALESPVDKFGKFFCCHTKEPIFGQKMPKVFVHKTRKLVKTLQIFKLINWSLSSVHLLNFYLKKIQSFILLKLLKIANNQSFYLEKDCLKEFYLLVFIRAKKKKDLIMQLKKFLKPAMF